MGEDVTSHLFFDRFAALRERFAEGLDERIGEIERLIAGAGSRRSLETLARAHRRAHDLCGVGPTMGFTGTGKAARAVEQVLLAAVKSERLPTDTEFARLRVYMTRLRTEAAAETQAAAGSDRHSGRSGRARPAAHPAPRRVAH